MKLSDIPVYPSKKFTSQQSALQAGIIPYEISYSGITLRQHYAGLAMQGILSSCPSGVDANEMPFNDWAKSAVKQADALIAELEKSNG